MNNLSNDNSEPPIFIVGNPRSGTTLLAVLIDRHSEISIPPETHYYDQFVHEYRHNLSSYTKEEMVFNVLKNERIKDLNLENQEILKQFSNYPPSQANLLRSILESYSIKRNKKKFGEKTPMHFSHVDEIITDFPDAKIICIIRDGRDSILSILNTPWGLADAPRRLEQLCIIWRENAKSIFKYLNKYPNNFILVKYEKLLLNPEKELRKICEFVEINYENRLLDNNVQTDVVPQWEADWKSNSQKNIDASRIEAWRNIKNQDKIWVMNIMMGKMLKKHGYRYTQLENCPIHKKILLIIKALAYLRYIRPFTRAGLRALQKLKLAT